MSHLGIKGCPPHPQFVKQVRERENAMATDPSLEIKPYFEMIQARIEDIEHLHKVRVLFAVESGSRAWGFESRDSDWDVRFIYVKPLENYVSVDEGQLSKVMGTSWEIPGEESSTINWKINEHDLDLVGWDLRKALQLLAKSNPPLLEWLRSPIVYKRKMVMDTFAELAESYYSPRACIYHYHHMAEGNFGQYIERKGDKVLRKKYLYVVRPILACRWIEMYETPAPMEIDKLIEGTLKNNGIRDNIVKLIENKRNNREMDEGPPDLDLNLFLQNQLEYFDDLGRKIRAKEKTDFKELNEFFFHVATSKGF